MSPTFALVLAPHPDDAELACGGLILRWTDAGRRIVVADMTRGECGTLGSAEIRAAEAAAASTVLGLDERINLGLPDAMLGDDEETVRAAIKVIRHYQPEILLAPLAKDLHPDHAATGMVAGRAFFLAGLKKLYPDLGDPHRPRLLLRYPLHEQIAPSFCVDISEVADRKQEAIRCFASQLGRRGRSDSTGLDLLTRAEVRDRFYGVRIGVRAAEPFASDGPLTLTGIEL